jgi:FKBP-type peptidyl-prolyl cis-trans isomerase FkpA
MATPKSQRIGIWVIAVVMLVGTVGGFAAMVLENKNYKSDQDKQNKLLEEYKKQQDEQEKRAKELSGTYYPQFKEYQGVPAVFDMNVGDAVTTRDLKAGDGEEITDETKYEAYYIGWNPKGKTFDSSFDAQSLKAPIDTTQISLIEGWNEGVKGMKVGGVREITIPSDKAYGEQGSGDDIPPNTPLKFIVMIIAKK